MAKTVTALYESYQQANSAVEDLVKHDFQRENISIMVQEAHARDNLLISARETSGVATGVGVGAAVGGVGALVMGLSALAIPGMGSIMIAGPLLAALIGAGVGAAAGGLIGALTDSGVPEPEAHYYAEGVRRGGVLVTMHAADDVAERAASVLATHHPIDLTQRVEAWRQSGWSRFDAAKAYDAKERKHRPLFLQPEHMHTPVKAYDAKAPTVVTATHQTREPAHLTDREACKEHPLIVTETDAEAVASKQARVVEEVLLRREAEEHAEPIRDTVRRTDVQVDQTGAAPQEGATGYEDYDAGFRRHYEIAFATTSGSTYEYYLPAYRYGYALATDTRYTGRDWTVIEPEARRVWEEDHAGTWEQFKDEIRYAWDTVTESR